MSDRSILAWLGDSPESATLARRARILVRRLEQHGIRPGDRVLYAVRPSLDSLPLVLAVLESGATLIGAPAGAGQVVFDAQMSLAQPTWVIGESAFIAAGRNALVRRAIAALGTSLPSFDALRARYFRVGAWLPGSGAAAISLASGDGDAPPTDNGRGSDDPMFIVFTSGTTAAPKAVMHSWGSVRATLDVIARQLDIARGDVMYARELHLLVPALAAGAGIAMPTTHGFEPARLLADLRGTRATHTFLVTAELQALLDHLARAGGQLPATLRHIMIGAAPVRAPFLRRLNDALPAGTKVSCIYGMTEMLPIATVTLEEKLAFTGAGDFVGRLVDGADARIADDGELVVRGSHRAGYLGQPPHAELATGDIARLVGRDVTLLGRKKDMIIRGQHNIYPELHEPVIERIPGVRRAAMVGVYDERASDERIVLFIEPENASGPAFAARVRQQLAEGSTRIDAVAQPERIVLGSIPLSGRSSKVDKVALRVRARVELGCA